MRGPTEGAYLTLLLSLVCALLSGCASVGEPAISFIDGKPEDSGFLPWATLTGRVVDADGHGIEGVVVEALVYSEGLGQDLVTRDFGKTCADGRWRTRVPAYIAYSIGYHHPDYYVGKRHCGWLRPDREYDVGTYG